MKLINKLTADPSQSMVLVGNAGQNIPFQLDYLPRQGRWMFNVAYGNWKLNGALLTVSPNILRNYQNNIPFGIGVTSNDELDPFYLDDFVTQRIKLYLLSRAEVLALEAALFP